MHEATSATSHKYILQQVMTEFLQQETSAMSNKWILQGVIMCEILKWAISATNNEEILHQARSVITMSNKQQVNFCE